MTVTIQRAIKLLEEEYERVKKNRFVRNPLAWSLYQVWKIANADQPEITPNTEAAIETIGERTHSGTNY